jgi:nicotinamidase-related amidase
MSELSLDAKKTALIAIDLQNAVVGMSTAPHTATEVVQRNRQVAETLRTKGGLVVWVRVDINGYRWLTVDQPSPFAGKQVPAELSQLAAQNRMQEVDLVITKRSWGAFAGTELEEQLRKRGIETVILTGISTNAGVESTLREGADRGFAVVVVEDACASQSADEHRYAIEKIFPRLARVRSTSEALKALA